LFYYNRIVLGGPPPPGKCPVNFNPHPVCYHGFQSTCKSDADCHWSKKCCRSGCNSACVNTICK